MLIPGSRELIIGQMGDATGLVISGYFAFVKIMWIRTAPGGDIIMDLFVTEVWGLVVALVTVWYGWKIPASSPNATAIYLPP